MLKRSCNLSKVLAMLLLLLKISATSHDQYNTILRERSITGAKTEVAEGSTLITWNLHNNPSVTDEESLWSRKRLCSEEHTPSCLDLSTGKCINISVGSDF